MSLHFLDLLGDDPEQPGKEGCEGGDLVTFTLDGLEADQDTIWVSGEAAEINLTAFGHYLEIAIERRTLGQDADSPPGPNVVVGHPVTWTYYVTNSGDVTLTSVVVVDDGGDPVSCPRDTLAPDSSVVCRVYGVATAGQNTNTATVTATPSVGSLATAGDLSHYYNTERAIVLEKSTKGQDADAPLAPPS